MNFSQNGSESSSTNDINYDVPRQMKMYKKSKIKDLLNIVPEPPVQQEIVYANARSFSFDNSVKSNGVNYCNANIVPNYVNDRLSINGCNPPPPRPPKPATLSRRQSSNNSNQSNSSVNPILDLLDSVPQAPPAITAQPPDLMYSFPKSQVELRENVSDLDAIVPLTNVKDGSTATIRPYTNAPPSFAEIQVNQFLAYEYKPNLPLFTEDLLTSSPPHLDTKFSYQMQAETNFKDTLKDKFEVQQTILSPQLAVFAATGTPAVQSGGGSVFKYSESAAVDICGPPVVNRQLKPKKSEMNSVSKKTDSCAQFLSNSCSRSR